ncbi:MAG: DUF805 domain-containing protein [Roseomonas sp.]|nr:DUF805 domain-containing protein [Roseomonas sp.]
MGALRAWFSFKGRISRKTWWLYFFLIPTCIIIAAAAWDDYRTPEMASPEAFGTIFVGVSPVSLIALCLWVWISLAGQAKRWHDHNKSGWWALVSLAAPLFLISKLAMDALGMWWFIIMHVFLPVIFSVFLFLPSLNDEPKMPWIHAAPDQMLLSGFFLLLILGWGLTMLIAGCLRGTPGPNRFGRDPHAPPDTTNIALPPQPQ